MIIKSKDLKKEGFYWMADKTETDATWNIQYIQQDIDAQEGYEVVWVSGSEEFECWDDIGPQHVFIGPLEVPKIAIPFERLEPIPLSRILPALSKVVPLTKIPPALVKIHK